jgi:hypothetical protein
MITCPMWPYRMNSNPFAAPVSEEQRQRARENFKRARISPERPTTSSDSEGNGSAAS